MLYSIRVQCVLSSLAQIALFVASDRVGTQERKREEWGIEHFCRCDKTWEKALTAVGKTCRLAQRE